MKQIKFFALLLLGFGMLLTSCTPENVEEIIDTTVEVDDKIENKIITRSLPNGDEGLILECVSIPLPFSFVTINDNIITIETIEDFEDVIEDTVDYVVDFVYPLTIIIDDEESTVNSIDELGEAFASCIPEDGWSYDEFPAFIIDESYCVSLTYPLEVTDIEGNIIEIDSEEDFIDAMASYEVLFFNFPMTVVDNETGELVEVANEDELFEALVNCDAFNEPCDSIEWGGEVACYSLVFPLDVELIDGSTVTVETEEDFNVLILGNEVANFVYPLDLLNEETGETITVNSDEELITAIISCSGFISLEFPLDAMLEVNGECFDLNYPVTVYDFNDAIVVNNEEELESYEGLGYLIQVPFSITLPNGDIMEVTSLNFFEFLELLENC